MLNAGRGTNQATGGNGNDIYDFTEVGATTTIMDFSTGDGDKIRIASAIADDFTDLTITNNGTSSKVTAGGLEIIVQGSQTLTASNFLLTPVDDEGGSPPGGGGNINFVAGAAGDDYLVGSTGADSIRGWAGNDFLLGKGGNDELFGGDGNDFLASGTGTDNASGEVGADTFYFGDQSATTTIKDFVSADGDKIAASLRALRNGAIDKFCL